MAESPSSRSPRPDLTDQRSWSLMRRLLAEAVRPYARHLFLALFCMALVAGATGVTAWLMDPVVDGVFVQNRTDLLYWVAGAVLATFLIKSLASFAQETLINYVGQRVVADTQNRLYAHLLAQDVGLFQARHSGGLISHFTFDINAMRMAVANALVGVGRDTLSVMALVGVMFYQEWALATITLVVGPLSAWPIDRLGRRMRRVSTETQEEMGHLTTYLSQSFQGIRMIKAYGMEAYESSRVREQVERIFRLTFRAARVRAAVQPIIDSLGGIAIAAVIVYGGTRVIEGVTTPGAFFSFITAALMAYQPLRALGKVTTYLQEGLAAADRVFTLLDQQPTLLDPPDPRPLPRRAGSVVFDKVSFRYTPETPALTDVSFTAPAGRITALVGPSGAGKSTVLSLISRFFDPEAGPEGGGPEGGRTEGAGTVRVNDQDVRQVSLADLRSALSLVSQDVVLFDDTVLNNIRFGRLDATEAEIQAAATAAAADGFIRDLPQGYETLVGEQGTKLSGGQRQRLAIARAILKDAPILLLDEATSALDTESERQIQEALRRLMAGRTTLVIAHRLSTIVDADVIHVFNQGRVAESGRHEELLKKNGLYARLHALQFSGAAAVSPYTRVATSRNEGE